MWLILLLSKHKMIVLQLTQILKRWSKLETLFVLQTTMYFNQLISSYFVLNV